MKKIILASKSPRRSEIMNTLGISFEVIPSCYDENLAGKKFSYDLINTVSKNKALEVAAKINFDALVIGADTVVVLGDEIFLKPKDENAAFEELKNLSGKTHLVITSISVVNTSDMTVETQATTSKVTFQRLTDEQIWSYIKTKKPLDKAGAYGIQELDESFVKSIEGSKNNVIGLSPTSLRNILLKLDKSFSLY